ncbi:hypothetical protein ACFQ6N_22480 [Kitasatospora sp. NPDC056446]|uniref:hypothetical protein n=1 Tax=Kitasatospora sp. NPDC056446 TaxID=3345819 RepID=UPI0036AE19ED
MSQPDDVLTAEEIQAHRQQAEDMQDALEEALRVARLPVPAGLSVAYGAVDLGYGPALHVGIMSAAQVQQWLGQLRQFARAMGYVNDVEARSLAADVLAEFRGPMLSGDGTYLVRKELGQ